MKQAIIKKIFDEFGLRQVNGKKLGLYRFEELIGFYTRLKNGEEVK